MLKKCYVCDFFADTKSTKIYSLVFLPLLILAAARFWGFMPSFLLGDDLSSYWLYKDSTLSDALTTPIAEKWRPFPTLLFWLELHVFNFGVRAELYWVVGVLIHSINAVLAFAIFRHLTGGRLMFSGLLAAMVAISHFALYQVTQATGLVEGPSLTFFLIIFLTLLTPSNLHSRAHLAVLMGAAFLLMHTHERYIGVMLWASMVISFSPRFREIEIKRRIYVAAGLISIPIYYLGIKYLVLDSSFLVGAGGKHIAIDFVSIFQFSKEALLSLAGINYGPPFLAGINLLASPEAKYLIPALLIAFTCILILLFGLKKQGVTDAVANNPWALFWCDKAVLIEILVLGMLILGPALLTIRLEQRWLLAPYILLLAMVAWSMGRIMSNPYKRRFAIVLFGCFSISTLVLQLAITPHLKSRVFFAKTHMYAEVIARDLPGFIEPSDRIGFLGNKQICVWVLGRGKFVRSYFLEPVPEIVCAEDVAAFDLEGSSAVTKVVGFNRERTRLHDLTESIRAQKR